MQQIVLLALAVLGLINTVLIIQIYYLLKRYHRDFFVETCDITTNIESLNIKREFDKLELTQEIQRVRSAIQNIPRDITVRNVLKLP